MEQPGQAGTGAPGHGALRVTVVSPEQVLFEGAAASVVAPAYDGLVGILPRHAPMLALLGRGPLAVRPAEGGEVRFRVAGGFIQVRGDTVRVVTEEASPIDGQGSVA